MGELVTPFSEAMKNQDSETGEEFYAKYKSKGNGNGHLPALLGNKGEGGRASREEFKDALYWLRDEFNRETAENQKLVSKSLRYARAAKKAAFVATGVAMGSLMMSGYGVFDPSRSAPATEYAHHEEKTRLTYLAVSNSVHQLDQQIAMLIEEKRQRDAQGNLERYAENDKFGALLKAVDALKSQVGLMDWYVKDDTRDLLESLKEFVQEQKRKSNEAGIQPTE